MKRFFFVSFLIFFLLLILCGVGGGLFLISLPDDIPSFDDSHLIRPIDNIQDKKNAFTFYSKAVDVLQYPKDNDLFDEIVEGKEWDEELIQTVLDENSEVFAFVTEGNLCRRCVVPRPTTRETPLPYLLHWRSIARLYSVKISSSIRNGKPEDALGDVLSLVQFSHKTQKDAGCLINYLMSIAVQDICMKSTCNLIWSGLLNDNQLAKLQDILSSNQPSVNGYILAWQTEYELFKNTTDELYAGDRLLDSDFTLSKANIFQNWYVKCFLHPNRTTYDASLIFSEIIDQASYCFAEAQFTDTEQFVLDGKNAYMATKGSAAFQTPNPLGVVVHKFLLPMTGGAMKSKCKIEVFSRATLLITALNRFKRANKALPKNLDELVPKFIPAIPLDPFDGKAMRYSLSNGVVYSVGENLEDAGGNTQLYPIKKPRMPLQWKTKDWLLGIEKKVDRNK